MNARDIGDELYGWASDLFPICRSITGEGVRQTLRYFQTHVPQMAIREVPSGTKAFDWTVPDEWTIRDAYVLDDQRRRVIDFKASNLHVVNYSEPVDKVLGLEELQAHLYSLPAMPDAIPYVTSYYERRWGFCLSDTARRALKPGQYRAVIDSTLAPGVLNYAELILPGETEEEVFLSSYVCHPSLANNELSGPIVLTALARWLAAMPRRRYTYRLIWIPETIGSIVYLSRNLPHMKRHMVAGFNISCVGDDRAYTYLASRAGDTLADRVAVHVLRNIAANFASYSFLRRGSDERQYCAPGIDLPVATLSRTIFADYPEYHTSQDDLSVISPEGLSGAVTMFQKCIEALEMNRRYRATVLGEPQLGRRALISNVALGPSKLAERRRHFSHLLAYCDGTKDLIAVADLIKEPAWDFLDALSVLEEHGLLEPLA